MTTFAHAPSVARTRTTSLTSAVIRFAGDSGDGMQLVGMQFTDTSALSGNDVSTFPDYPSEIRAPAGTLAGVSGFQIHFSSHDIFTPGDELDALVAMNPAALKANLKLVKSGGILLVNADAFSAPELKKAGYDRSPLEDGLLCGYRLIRTPIDTLNQEALKDSGLTPKQIDQCKNFFALGLVYWLYDRPLEPTLPYIQRKFGKKHPVMAAADARTLRAGYAFGETAELFAEQYQVPKADLPPGIYRKISGNEALVLGLFTAAHLAYKQLVYPSYPITPATDVLHGLAELKHHGVLTFQAEDEICAMGAAIGAAYGGALAVTGTSGPGLALKSEAINLAVMTELPVVIIDVQRGGPSTGLPTKTEQSDLQQALFGRNGESPVPVIAASSPSDCYLAAIEACRIAVRYMTPVLLLSDGYVGNSAEPWKIPDVDRMPPIPANHPTEPLSAPCQPYTRNADGARPWAIPGTPGYEHRIGGLEKQDLTGTVSYDGPNHERMVQLRAAKIAGIKPAGVPYLWSGERRGDVLIIGWGGTYGAIRVALSELAREGLHVSACHLRYLNPLPEDLAERLSGFSHVIVAELNLGQLAAVLRAKYLLNVKTISKVRGQPFTVQELVRGVRQLVAKPAAEKPAPEKPAPAAAPHHHNGTHDAEHHHNGIQDADQLPRPHNCHCDADDEDE
jgi:2-oxoglutarate ferredoxin oxidoreductase subunit alpha